MSAGRERLKAVLLDWAGTTVDYGSRAPTEVFIEIFRRRGVLISQAEARGPMGRAKHEHIAEILSLPRVSALWREKYGELHTDADVRAMYDDFLPLQKSTLARGSDVIAGVPETIAELRSHGLKIGSSTGYTRELMDVVRPIAAIGGYEPDVVICSDDVPAGRPAPWMNFLAAQRLNVYPMNTIFVVDDTPVGIAAAKNAGMPACAVSLTGNSMGLSADEVANLSERDRANRLTQIEDEFRAAGADYVIESVADLPQLLRQHALI